MINSNKLYLIDYAENWYKGYTPKQFVEKFLDGKITYIYIAN